MPPASNGSQRRRLQVAHPAALGLDYRRPLMRCMSAARDAPYNAPLSWSCDPRMGRRSGAQRQAVYLYICTCRIGLWVVARVNATTGRCSRGTSGLWALGFRQRACTAQRHNIHVAPGGGFGVLHITRGYAAAVQQQCKPTSELQGVHCGPAAGRDWQVSYCG